MPRPKQLEKPSFDDPDHLKIYTSQDVMDALGISRNSLYLLSIRARAEPEKRYLGGILFNFFSMMDMAKMKAKIDPRRKKKTRQRSFVSIEKNAKKRAPQIKKEPVLSARTLKNKKYWADRKAREAKENTNGG